MRKVGLLALGAALGLAACTSILGDFSVGDGGATDGGNDVQQNDVVTNDAPADVVTDAGPDVQPVKLANCTLDLQSKLTTFLWPTDAGVSDGDRTIVLTIPQKNRVFIQTYNFIWYADFNDNDQTATLQQFSFQGQILNSTHVTQGTSAETIFAVYDQNGANGHGTLSTITWPDTPGSPPVAGLVLVPDFSQVGGTPVTNTLPIKAAITALDITNNDYIFAMQYSLDGNTFNLYAGHAHGQPTDASSFKKVDASGGPDFNMQTISHDQQTMFVWLTPGGNNQSPQGPAPLYSIDIGTLQAPQPRLLQPTSGLYAPFAFAAGSPGTTDTAFIEGDLNNPNQTPIMHTQAMQTSAIGTFDPSKVPGAQVAFSSLPFNKGVSHWTTFQTEDEWVGAGRTLNGPGANILWFDSKGNARALMTQTDGGNGFPGSPINSIDMTFQGPPTQVFTNIRVAWTEGQGNQNNPKVFSAAGACTSF